jgi:hypothetical protein
MCNGVGQPRHSGMDATDTVDTRPSHRCDHSCGNCAVRYEWANSAGSLHCCGVSEVGT